MIRSAKAVQEGVELWETMRHGLDGSTAKIAAWDALDRQAGIVDGQIELLVNYTAGDGFVFRQTARKVVAQEVRFNLIAMAIALILSGFVAYLLNRRITGPLAAASSVAERIAAYEWDLTDVEDLLRAESAAMRPEVAVVRGFDEPVRAAQAA